MQNLQKKGIPQTLWARKTFRRTVFISAVFYTLAGYNALAIPRWAPHRQNLLHKVPGIYRGIKVQLQNPLNWITTFTDTCDRNKRKCNWFTRFERHRIPAGQIDYSQTEIILCNFAELCLVWASEFDNWAQRLCLLPFVKQPIASELYPFLISSASF